MWHLKNIEKKILKKIFIQKFLSRGGNNEAHGTAAVIMGHLKKIENKF